MPTHVRMILTVFRRNFFAYFINPTGYVFITVFILLGAVAAFWQQAFFLNNLANLDQLNAYFPILLLFFVPALTMNAWSEERRLGTDELLFTLPGHDVDIVLGKYLAVLGIYTVAVLFSLSHLVILIWLGEPDIGLMFSSYLGYWLAGGALLAAGMVASLLTANATVAFILGAVLCGVFVFVDRAETVFSGAVSDLVRNLGVRPHFTAFGDGVIPLSGILYFLGVTVVMLYLNVALVGRRHVVGGQRALPHALHVAIRSLALALGVMAVDVMADRTGQYLDATAERLHTLQPQTRELVDQMDPDRPVYIQAFLSPEVPEAMVRTRKNLLNVLRRLDDVGGPRIELVVHDTEPYTDVATDAAENYDITPRRVLTVDAGQQSTTEVFLGLVFTSGPDEFVIPFFDRGLPVEYELARSIRVVSRSERKSLGVITTDAQLFGGFDFQSMTSRPDWSIVTELRKQYDVQQVAATGPYPEDLDALLAVLPSSLTQPELDALEAAILSGAPTLVIDDPLPMFNPQLSPSLPKDASRNPFTSQGQPPSPPKGDFDGFLATFGLRWRVGGVVWCAFNPHPSIADAAPEIVFVCDGPDNDRPFNPDSVISSGLQEVVMIYPGFLTTRASESAAALDHTALLQTGVVSGESDWNSLVTRGLFGLQLNPNPRRFRSDQAYTLAMHVSGTIATAGSPEVEVPGPSQEAEPDPLAPAREVPIRLIMVSDVDSVSETFFDLRRQGLQGFNFDNVTFALNCIDVLAGDESFVALRKHRPRHRTLTRVEALSKVYEDQSRTETEAAEARAAEQLQQAQQRLNQRVQELQSRTDLDEQTKRIMLSNLESVESRRLQVVEANIGQEKDRSIARARAEMETAVARIQRRIRWWAAALPPVPTLLLAIGLFAYRYQRERVGVSERQRVEASS
ncbi:MAG: Gldg family protein [Planctomycetota bacterium]|jgi:ABC-2 type transport system permease protein